MVPEHIHLSISSHPENLKQIRSVMDKITSQTRLSEEDSGSIILAVDEACSNIIKHCCKNDPTRNIDLTIKLEADYLIITIVDNGIKFNIQSIKARDISDIKPGGLGVHIIKKVMDTVKYSHTPEGFNRIIMTKKLTD